MLLLYLMHAEVRIYSRIVQRRPLEVDRKTKKPIKKQVRTQEMKTKNYNVQKNNYWAVEDREKVLFSDESHFFVQGKHSRFVRIRKGEQLSPAHFNELVKDLQKMFSGSFTFPRVGSPMPSEV